MSASEPTGLTPAQLAVTEQHIAAARQQADRLATRARTLAGNGVDLRHPARYREFFTDVIDAVRGATVPGCGCGGADGPAAVALIVELSRRLAEATR